MERAERVALGRLLAAATAEVAHPDQIDLEPICPACRMIASCSPPQFDRVEGCLHESLRDTAGVDPSLLETLGNPRRLRRFEPTGVRALGTLADYFAAADVPASLLYRNPGLVRATASWLRSTLSGRRGSAIWRCACNPARSTPSCRRG